MVGSLASVSLPQWLPLSGWIVGTLYVVGNFLYLLFLVCRAQTTQAALHSERLEKGL